MYRESQSNLSHPPQTTTTTNTTNTATVATTTTTTTTTMMADDTDTKLSDDFSEQHNSDDDDLKSTRSSVRTEGGNDEWRPYQKKMSEQLALQKLREAVQLRDRTMLEDAIDECRTHDSLSENPRVQSAEIALKILQANKDLKAACENKDPVAIKEQMKSIRSADLAQYLDTELISAKYLLESLQKRTRKPVVLDLNKSTMSEIRRYQNPPKHVHRVMQAVWLLLGEDEETTEDWRTIQRLSVPQGHNGLRRKILEFDPSKVNVEMAAAASAILDAIQEVEKVKTCAAAWTFYVWAKGMCEAVLGDNTDVTPADRHRQKEILERLPQPTQRMDRVYYKQLVTAQQPPHNKTTATSSRQNTQSGSTSQFYDQAAGNDYEPE